MDININVKMDGDTTKAIALLAESILSAGSALASVESGSTSAAPAAAEAPAEVPPKRTRRSRAKPAAAVEAPATEKVEAASAPEVPAPVKITRDTVRKAAGTFIEAGNDREEVKGWLEEFGAISITSLDEKHLPKMYEHLTA